MIRETGHYWVRDKMDGWVIAKWDSGWEVPGYECTFYDYEFIEIDERRIEATNVVNPTHSRP